MVLTCSSLWAAKQEGCFHNSGSVTKEISGFVISIRPGNPKDAEDDDAGCRVVIRDRGKKAIFAVEEFALSIALLGQDVNGDGAPDVVLEGYSGGAHCCWTYYIVSLGDHPGLVRSFQNERGAGFERYKQSGKIEIYTMDGGFDYFAFLSHGETPFPSVYLQLDGKQFVDVSSSHLADYEEEIAGLEKHLTPKAVNQLRSVRKREQLTGDTDNRRTASYVLAIVFAYLYSGRETHAHQYLKKTWPAFDQPSMWALILQTRHEGILRYTRKGPPKPATAVPKTQQ
jgi:hypothetical protein